MKTAARLVIFIVATLVLLAICSGARPASAGETSVYLRSGWFTWDETINGSSFVKEKGWMNALGVTRRDDLPALTIGERFEVWGGNLQYDGHDVTGVTPMNSDTSYLGTREEVAISKGWPLGGELLAGPLLGLGHKFWIRTRSDEDWNTFYLKAGVGAEYGGGKFFVKGGALIPFYTRNHTSLTSSGFTDVVTEPACRASAFAEGGVQMGAFALSIDYEGMNFGESSRVSTSRIATSGTGVAVANTVAYQPASSSSFVSLKLSYSF